MMTDKKSQKSDDSSVKKMKLGEARAEALRANLKKRKDQAVARQSSTSS